jgi:soluble lytic murein transglycosylase-like protein
MRGLFIAAALLIYTLGIGFFLSYVFFYYPIKTDRYKHSFAEHLSDRLTAYVLLARSNWRIQNWKMGVEKIQAIVTAASERNGVEPCLVRAVTLYESNLNPNTISTTGAIGLMALQPDTAAALSVEDPFDPYANVDGGARLLRQLSQGFNGNVDLILAGYNAGADAITRYAGVPPFPETRDYVAYVGGIFRLCQSNPEAFGAK